MNPIVYLTLLGVVAVSVCQEQTSAEKDGTVVVDVLDITIAEFEPLIGRFRDVVAWHLSIYCKKGKNNCWGEDKQIRSNDIIIRSAGPSVNDVAVTFYVRDRYDHYEAAMEDHQVRRAFGDHGSDMGDEFQRQMRLVSPEKEGMEIWIISLIAICGAIGLALIIAVAVLCDKQCRARREREEKEDMLKDRLENHLEAFAEKEPPPSETRYMAYSEAEKEKINPGYDTDSEEPSTSADTADKPRNVSPPPEYDSNSDGGTGDNYTLVKHSDTPVKPSYELITKI